MRSVRRDQTELLPLPKRLRDYLNTAHYYSEQFNVSSSMHSPQLEPQQKHLRQSLNGQRSDTKSFADVFFFPFQSPAYINYDTEELRILRRVDVYFHHCKTKTKNLTVKLRNNPNNISLFHVFLFDEGNNHIIILKITIHIRLSPVEMQEIYLSYD